MEVIHFLDWYGVNQSVPNTWKNRIKNMQTNCLLVGKKKNIRPYSLSSSMIYEAYINKFFKPPTSGRYFERIFRVMDEEKWRNIYTKQLR